MQLMQHLFSRHVMSRIRFGLKWFLLATTLIAALIGTVGKWAYDEWQQRQWLVRQQHVAQALEQSYSGVLVREGRVVEAHITPRTGGARAMHWLKDATELERLRVSCSVTDNDIALLE